MPSHFFSDSELDVLLRTLGLRIEYTNPDGYTRGIGSDVVYGVFNYEQEVILDQFGLNYFPENAALLRVRHDIAAELVPGTEVSIQNEVWVVRSDVRAAEGDGSIVALGISPSGSL